MSYIWLPDINTILVATWSTIVDNIIDNIIVNNWWTAVTITLPDPWKVIWKRITISRYAWSTWTITIINSWTSSIQWLNGAIWASKTINPLWNNENRNHIYLAATVWWISSWLKIW